MKRNENLGCLPDKQFHLVLPTVLLSGELSEDELEAVAGGIGQKDRRWGGIT